MMDDWRAVREAGGDLAHLARIIAIYGSPDPQLEALLEIEVFKEPRGGESMKTGRMMWHCRPLQFLEMTISMAPPKTMIRW